MIRLELIGWLGLDYDRILWLWLGSPGLGV